MTVSMIMAAAENGVIGKDNDLPWHLPDDFRYFKSTTSGHTVIMGRKTYEALGKALPKRTNVVISRRPDFQLPDATVVNSLEAALAGCAGEEEVFIIGGGAIYQLALDQGLVDRIYLTVVHTEVEGDTHFFMPEQGWKRVSADLHGVDERHAYPFTFEIHERSLADPD